MNRQEEAENFQLETIEQKKNECKKKRKMERKKLIFPLFLYSQLYIYSSFFLVRKLDTESFLCFVFLKSSSILISQDFLFYGKKVFWLFPFSIWLIILSLASSLCLVPCLFLFLSFLFCLQLALLWINICFCCIWLVFCFVLFV